MVDKDKIVKACVDHFHFTRDYEIDDEGCVSTNGTVKLITVRSKIAVQFKYVGGHFECANKKLISLEGSPREVGKTFDCRRNRLTTLVGAPEHVGDFVCIENPLVDLVGLSSQIDGAVSFNYTPQLPLLRTLVADKIWPYPDQVELEVILNKYKGQGKAAILKCAAELIKAGFKDNARW